MKEGIRVKSTKREWREFYAGITRRSGRNIQGGKYSIAVYGLKERRGGGHKPGIAKQCSAGLNVQENEPPLVVCENFQRTQGILCAGMATTLPSQYLP